MLARSIHRASRSIIDASVGAQEIVSAFRDVRLLFYSRPKVTAASRFIEPRRSRSRARK